MKNILFLIFIAGVLWKFSRYLKKRRAVNAQSFQDYYAEIWSEGGYPLLGQHYTLQEICKAYENTCVKQMKKVDYTHFLETLESELRKQFK
ncbi:hypothetical protein WDW89_19575 [Deltaproteobacteria bacterium TL4]